MSSEHTRSRSLFQTGTRTGTRTRGGGDTSRSGATGAPRTAALRRWWGRAVRNLRRWWRAGRQAVTPIGWFVLAAVVVGAVVGASVGWIEGWFVAILGATLMLIALPFLLGARSYRIRLLLGRASVVAGDTGRLGVEVENTASRPQLPAVAELPVGDALREITVPLLAAHRTVTLPIEVPAPRRSVIQLGPINVARRDPLALLRREVTWRDRHLLYVHPVTTMLPPNSAGMVRDLEGDASRRLTDADLSFHAVREYVPGDAVRHIHWKSTAKTGALMIRQYEESQTARTAVLFDAVREEYASDDEYELAVSVAASISLQSVREGRERYVASAWASGRTPPRVDGLEELPSREAGELLNAWAELTRASEMFPIERLARSLAESGRDLSIVVIVTGSRPEVSRIRRAAVAFSPDVRILAVRCELLADPRVQRMDPLALATVGALTDLPQLMLRGGL